MQERESQSPALEEERGEAGEPEEERVEGEGREEPKETKEREREQESVELIEQSELPEGKKYDLTLLVLGRKEVAFLGNHDVIEGEMDPDALFEEFREEQEAIREVAESADLSVNAVKELQYENGVVGYNLAIGRSEETLDNFAEAEKEGDTKTMGKLLGYPHTAVEAYGTERAMDAEVFFQQKVSEEERTQLEEEGVLDFLDFQPSREYWREELEQVRENQRIVQERAPRVYAEITEEDTSGESAEANDNTECETEE